MRALRCGLAWRRIGPVGTAAARPGRAIRWCSESELSPHRPNRPTPDCRRQSGPRDLRILKARAPAFPFFGEGRAGRNCTPTARMRTVFDFAATRPAHLARAPRPRGRAAPPGATRRTEVRAMGVVDVASRRLSLFGRSDPNLLQAPISGRLRPLRDHSQPDLDAFVTIRDRPKRPRPLVFRLRRVDWNAFGFFSYLRQVDLVLRGWCQAGVGAAPHRPRLPKGAHRGR